MNDMEIVIGLEDDPPSTAALRWAVQQAMRTGARLRVVHVWTPPMAEMSSPRAVVRQAHQQDVRARVTQTVNRVLEDMSVRTNWVLELVEGSPGPMLLHCAQSAELLVLGGSPRRTLLHETGSKIEEAIFAHAPSGWLARVFVGGQRSLVLPCCS